MPESHESSECRARPAVEFSADPQRLDHDRVHALLAEHTSWAQGRTRRQQDAIIAHSRNYGMYLTESGEQVAYARVVTDMVTFAWLADVIVDPAFGRRGTGGALIEGVLADLRPLGLKRVVLKASDQGRPLYERAGWHGLGGVDDWMELRP